MYYDLNLDAEDMFKQRLSTADFHLPSTWIGSTLSGTARMQFINIRKKIDLYNLEPVSSENIITVLDEIEKVKDSGHNESLPVLGEVVNYLRTLLLHSDTEIVFHTVILLDCIVKNSGYLMHVLIGRRKFMKTLSLIARRHLSETSESHKRVGVYTIDCIQAWGEAFLSRSNHYPHIYQTYSKLRTKYFIKFPRPDFDPTRVPIFLGEMTSRERELTRRFNHAVEDNYSSISSKATTTEEDEETAEAIRRSLQEVSKPRDTINYGPMRKFSTGEGTIRAGQHSKREEEADLEAALSASLLSQDLIDLSEPSLKPSAATGAEVSPAVIFTPTITSMTTAPLDLLSCCTIPEVSPAGASLSPSHWSSPQRAAAATEALSPVDRILSLYSSPPRTPQQFFRWHDTADPAYTQPYGFSPPLIPPLTSTLTTTLTPTALKFGGAADEKVRNAPSSSLTPMQPWNLYSEDFNPFDLFPASAAPYSPQSTLTTAPSASCSIASTTTSTTQPQPTTGMSTSEQQQWALDTVWSLEKMAAAVSISKQSPQPQEPATPSLQSLFQEAEPAAVAVPTHRPPRSPRSSQKVPPPLPLSPAPPLSPPPPIPTAAPLPPHHSPPPKPTKAVRGELPGWLSAPSTPKDTDLALSKPMSISSSTPHLISTPAHTPPPPPSPSSFAQASLPPLHSAPAPPASLPLQHIHSRTTSTPLEPVTKTDFAETIKQARERLNKVEERPRTVTTTPEPALSNSAPYDPTAGPAPQPATRAISTRKNGYHAPSSDPDAQVIYYGHQRVVIRKPSAPK